jgi:hypothetical protein
VAVEAAPAFEVDVDVHAAATVEQLEAQDVRALDRVPDPLEGVAMTEVGGDVLLRPQPVVPPRMMVPPRLHESREVGG